MLHESIKGLNIKPDGIYVDVTFGGGGHSREILAHLKNGSLLAFDQDRDSLLNDIHDDRFTLINHNFIFLKNYLHYMGINHIDGLLADLGVSSHQFDTAERGFSYRYDAELDMRMDKETPAKVSEVINTLSVEELASIMKNYGEIKKARAIAEKIVEIRRFRKITTTSDLSEIAKAFAYNHESQMKLLSLLFQSFRIAVNDEIKALKKLLKAASELLSQGGRLVVISYHSLEDRLVKNFMKCGNFEGESKKDLYGNPENALFRVLTTKAITPMKEELIVNGRARSAKLRIAEKM